MIRGVRLALASSLSRFSQFVSPRQHAASYRAARSDQWSGDWMAGMTSMNRTLRADLATVRDRSRDLVMNDSTAARIPSLFSENISGKDGIQYQAVVQSAAGEMDTEANKALEAGWYRWAEDPQQVTAERRQTWPEVEAMLDELEVRDGETLLRKLPGFKNKYRYAVQVLDIDQLDIGYNVDAGPNRNAIVMGVEVDQWGAAVAYWIWPNHPSEVQRRGERIRVPAADIEHTFLSKSPGQVRGVPWMAPVITDLMHMGQARTANVVAMRVSASKMGFITDEEGLYEKTDGSPAVPETMTAEPGVIPRLRRGEKFVAWDPQHPTGNYDAFDRAILRSVAGAVRLSYMSLSGDLSATSYASGRMGYLGERGMYQTLQERKVLRICRPVHRAWLPMALVSGQVALNRSDVAALIASEWHPRAFPSIDPLKDANTNAINYAMGADSLTDILAAEGKDIRTVFTKIRDERKLAEEFEINLFLPVGAATPVDGEDAAAPITPNADRETARRADTPALRVV